MWRVLISICFALELYRDLLGVFAGGLLSWLVSKRVAEEYFNKQFQKQEVIDIARAEKEVQLVFKKLSNAFIRELFRRKPKTGSLELQNEMSEAKHKLETYRPDFDANEMIRKAAEAAAQTILSHPNDFEEIPRE
jgi:hypothetical protein